MEAAATGWPEFDEVVFEFAAERLFDRAPRFRHGERRQLVLQVREILLQCRRDQVAAGGQKLAELDV